MSLIRTSAPAADGEVPEMTVATIDALLAAAASTRPSMRCGPTTLRSRWPRDGLPGGPSDERSNGWLREGAGRVIAAPCA